MDLFKCFVTNLLLHYMTKQLFVCLLVLALCNMENHAENILWDG